MSPTTTNAPPASWLTATATGAAGARPGSTPGYIVVVGSLNCDVIVRSAALPRPGETILGHDGTLAAGGKGLNQAVAARAAGSTVTLVGMIGTDPLGARLIEHARANDVDCRFVGPASDCLSGVAAILVSESGENMIAVAPGANAMLTPEHIDYAKAAIATADVLLTQLETPFETVAAALAIARGAGTRTILNPAPADRRALELCPLVDVLTPNEHELSTLTGIALDGSDAELRRALQMLVDTGAKTVIVTLGGAGCAALSKEGLVRLPAFQVDVADTTAAGDTFNGTFAAAFATGAPLHIALTRASAAAAISVSRATAEGAAPTASEIDAFLASSAAIT